MSKFIMPGGREYPIAMRDITNKEARMLQEVAGKGYLDLVADLEQQGPDGKTAFLWLAMRKNGHHVEFDTLEFPMGRMQFVYDEPDPTKGSDETPEPEQSSSLQSTTSSTSNGSPSPQS